uniref:Leucine-rich repeat-containing protein 29 isoform X2 n=1 Tax=Geotrypetes seraphini TaxID=260995 RepID=A0A6P8RD85_GEOSA|nr:leucine-rich repeat-containing protein 29 isoform X2 [Geotrypetes seraphini]
MMGSQELPLEIISHILSFLPLSDWKEASLVNRTWYFASQDTHLQRKVVYNLPASSSSLHIIQGLARRCAPCISLNNLDSSNVSRDVIKYISFYLGPHLESLSLRGSCLTDSSFIALIQNCPNLHSLDLSGCNSFFMSGTLLSKQDNVLKVREALNNLRELNLSGIRYLSDLIFNRLISCTPRLEKLLLARCHITFEFDPYRGSRNYNSSSVLSFRNILTFLKERVNCMKALDLSSTGVTTEAVRSLVQVEQLNLRELALQNCKDLSSEAVSILCKWQPNLTSLNLSGCSELSDSAVLAVSSHLQSLQHLYLAKVRRLTDIGLRGIADLKELQSLDMSECSLLNGSELVKGLSSSHLHPKLQSLSFASCCLLKDISVVSLAGSLGAYLRILDLSSCMTLTDISIQAISTHLNRLTILRLAWCKELTDWGLLGIMNPDKELNPNTEKDNGPAFSRNFGNMGFFTPPQYLDEKPRLLTDSDLVKSREKPSPSLKSLQCLQELDLTACSKLTDISITQVSEDHWC